ncbi:DEAD/DEAH box helicase family protein [Pseudomonas fildesensis]|uniref:DEAD/DEAH box helicase family protein n=1 Tax=Pseudomonas fildesensis TaxID=1674920 RepID=UPI00387B6820
MNKKIIHTSIATPGTGKTMAAIAAIPGMLGCGKKILYVAPTLALADQVLKDIRRICSSLEPIIIDSRCEGSAEANLNKMLNPKENANLIICQHVTFQRCSTKHLNAWTIIIDELPMPISLRHMTFDPVQLKRLDLVENIDNQIKIKKNMYEAIKNEVTTFEKSNSPENNKTDTTLSAAAKDVYKAVLNKLPVFADTYYSGDEKTVKKTVIRIIEEYGFFERFHMAQEVHLLSATLRGSLFDWFAKAKGFTYAQSYFAPTATDNNKNVTIYPMLSDKNYCSRGVLDSLDGSSNDGYKVLQSMTNLIDKQLATRESCLMFAYNWGKNSHSSKFKQCKIDSRGLNNFTDTHSAFTAFHGNPNPLAYKSLEYIANKYNRSMSELQTAWKFTYKLEMTLQNVFRTSLRSKAIDEPVKLYVQDNETAYYLKSAYLPNANIDDSLAKTYKEKKKPGPTPHPERERAIIMLQAGMKQAVVARATKLDKMTICKYAKAIRQIKSGENSASSTHTLEQWL